MAKIRGHVSSDGLHRAIDSGGFAPTVWYHFVPSGIAELPRVETSDFAAIALLPFAMNRGEPLELDFAVNSSLLDGLDHYQEVWHRWSPNLFPRQIKITAATEYSRPPRLERPARAVLSFSAGVDSTFAMLRHKTNAAGRNSRDIRTAVMVHGFDMPLESDAGFNTLRKHGEVIASALAVNFVAVRTNWRHDVSVNWPITFGTGLAAILHQFAAAHDSGLDRERGGLRKRNHGLGEFFAEPLLF
jgi:hypothetical protein